MRVTDACTHVCLCAETHAYVQRDIGIHERAGESKRERKGKRQRQGGGEEEGVKVRENFKRWTRYTSITSHI